MSLKMFLVSSHQLRHLTPPDSSIRQTAEEDLDESMRKILNERGLTPDEKIKKYNALLQRCLTLMKQGQREERSVTLTLPQDPSAPQGAAAAAAAPFRHRLRRGPEPVPERNEDVLMTEVLNALPQRFRKKGEYILQKLRKTTDGGWTSRGEFVHQGQLVEGTHVIDLLQKAFHSSFKTSSSPRGWENFLQTLSDLNIPQSYVTNPQARDQYRRLRKGEPVFTRRRILLLTSWSTPPVQPITPQRETVMESKKQKRQRWTRFTP